MKNCSLSSRCLALLLRLRQPANAAELKIFGSRVTKVIVGELGPQFEKATGFTPVVTPTSPR